MEPKWITYYGKRKKCFGIHTNGNYIIKMKFKDFLYLMEETKQEAIKESGLSPKEFTKQVING